MDDIDLRRQRAARNQSLFREVNERIAELAHRFIDELTPNVFVCECLEPSCTETFELTLVEYERFRQRGARFFVLPGHEDPAVENVVEATDRYVVVEKVGAGAAVAESLNPRNAEQPS